jgi:hypothetical protein
MAEPLTIDLLNALEAFFRLRTKGKTINFASHVACVELDTSVVTQSITDLRKKFQTEGLGVSDVLLLRLLYEISGIYYSEHRWRMWGNIPIPSLEERL